MALKLGGWWVAASWYLFQTKAGEERKVREQLTRVADEVLLPLAKTRVQRWGRSVESVAPLFRCYLFAQVDLARQWLEIHYMRGLRAIVSFGDRPAVVPDSIIAELRERCALGPVELRRRQLRVGEQVTVLEGPLRGLEGVFERELSNSERVEVLLSAMAAGARAVLPADMVAPVA